MNQPREFSSLKRPRELTMSPLKDQPTSIMSKPMLKMEVTKNRKIENALKNSNPKDHNTEQTMGIISPSPTVAYYMPLQVPHYQYPMTSYHPHMQMMGPILSPMTFRPFCPRNHCKCHPGTPGNRECRYPPS